MLKYYFIVLMFTALSLSVFAQNIKAVNTTQLSKKKGYYDWTILIQSDTSTLNSIDHVEYLLHSTFSNPQVSSYDRKSSFSYSTSGWGEFEIKIKVVFKDKNKGALYMTHWLVLKT